MQFNRLNNLRKNKKTRDLVAEHSLDIKDVVQPYFVIEGKNRKESVESMHGIYRFSIDKLLEDIDEAKNLGINSILIFGVTNKKDENAKASYEKNGIVQKTVKSIKNIYPDITVITDVCLCGYTNSGHCGIIKANSSKLKAQSGIVEIDEEQTLKVLANIAVSHAKAGADFVAPSAMMDGQVRIIRKVLDKNGYQDIGILGYSAKYASGFYGPFRDAAQSGPEFGDRKTYQMDYRNSDQAILEISSDINEGADIVMVKPALSYLDVIYRASKKFNIPLAAYNVSGEYSLVKHLSNGNLKKEKELALEILTSIKRAGADIIITYFAKNLRKWLKNDR